jgi:putative ABC transport system substrate-binding protein
MRRRDFITLLGGAAAWPVAARAQQPALPVIGVLSSRSSTERDTDNFRALAEGLRDAGYVEDRNLKIEFRFAENHYEKLPSLAAEFVRLKVAVIFAGGGGQAQLAAKAATATIPIVFTGGSDPVQSGLVPGLNRPGGNITGVTFATNVSESKRLGLLHAAVPAAIVIGVLMNPDNAGFEVQSGDLSKAAAALGLKLEIAQARNEADFEPAIAGLVSKGARGLLIASDAFFTDRVEPLAALASRYRLPAIYADDRNFAAAGGLISYGTNRAAAYHQAGIYIGRILHGEKPGDLPVMLPTHYDLVINIKTGKTLGIEVPPTLSAIADEIIE